MDDHNQGDDYEKIGKVITTKDGTAYPVTFKRWFWDQFDFLEAEGWIDKEIAVEFAHECALRWPGKPGSEGVSFQGVLCWHIIDKHGQRRAWIEGHVNEDDRHAQRAKESFSAPWQFPFLLRHQCAAPYGLRALPLGYRPFPANDRLEPMSNDLTLNSETPPERALATGGIVPDSEVEARYSKRLPGSFWLGRSLKGRAAWLSDDSNLLTCAGPGMGKGISTVVPNLLTYDGSAVVIDPKGELASMTAAYRRDVLGQKVIVLDPAKTADIPDDLRGTFNPLDALDPRDEETVVAMAQSIAGGIVVPDANAKDSKFWDDNATAFISGVILYIINQFPKEKRTLMKLRETVAMGDWDLYQEYLAQKREFEPDFNAPLSKAYEMLLSEMAEMDHYGGIVRQAAAEISKYGDTTQGNILGGASTHLSFLAEPRLWDCLRSNPDPARTFTLGELRKQDRFTTVYLCLPVDMMTRQGRWLRLILSQITAYMERTQRQFDKARHVPLLMMIDEFAQLGPIPTIDTTLTYARGSGLRIWLIIQSINQLKDKYPQSWETILGACSVLQFFGLDTATAKYVSEKLGDMEIAVPSVTMTRNEASTEGKTTSDTTGTSRSETDGTSFSRAAGTSRSSTTGISHTEGISANVSHGTSKSFGTSHSTGTSESQGTHEGRNSSEGWNEGSNQSTSSGNTVNHAQPYAHSPTSHSVNEGRSSGTSSGRSGGTGTSSGTSSNTGTSSQSGVSMQSGQSTQHSEGWSRSTTTNQSETFGTSLTETAGQSHSLTYGENRSRTEALSASLTEGKSYAITVNRQARRVFKQEELELAFTRDNLMQLVFVRDRGAHLLRCTPFFSDLSFQRLMAPGDE
jgi:type IV secretory pathway TraG/TraD family ATPase VirD4